MSKRKKSAPAATPNAPKTPAPRPTTCTAHAINAICSHVRAGSPLTIAAPAAGIPYDTAKTWMARGRKGESPYADYTAAVIEAKAAWAASAVRVINDASYDPKNWKAAAWLLERRLPDEFYIRREDPQQSQPQGLTMTPELEAQVTEALALLDDPEVQALLAKRKGTS